jgi:hypothetical protein
MFEPTFLLHFFFGRVSDWLRERPMMTFEVDGHIRAISIELIGRLHGDFRSRLPRSRAVLIDAARETYVNALRVLSTY